MDVSMQYRTLSLVFLALPCASACRVDDTKPAGATVQAAPWLEQRAQQQRASALQTEVMEDLGFSDQAAQSGITFVNRIVDDAGKDYNAGHYENGSGVCAADVDNDGLPDLYFVTQLGTNELWKNLGGGKFRNITSEAGLAMPDAIAVGCAFADIDNDGLPDLFVTTVRHGNHLFKNQGGGKFTDITASAGVGYSGHSSGAVFFDYDRDGLLDLFVANVGTYTTNAKGRGGYYVGLPNSFRGHMHPERAEASILYHNLGGGRFRDVTQATGLVDKSWSGDAVVIDVNDDSLPDLFVLNMQGTNHLWVNVGGQTFRDSTAAYFNRTPWGAMGGKAFDFDGDERLDLFVTDMQSDMFTAIPAGDWVGEATKSNDIAIPEELFTSNRSLSTFKNSMYVNRDRRGHHGLEALKDVSLAAAVETYWPWGPSVDDINADGWDDIFITGGMNFPSRYAVNTLLLNENGKKFSHAEFVLGIEPRAKGTHQDWFTVDCNGADKANPACKMCANADSVAVMCRAEGGKQVVMAARGSRSAILLDIDNDGDLDIVTNEFNGGPQILISDYTSRHAVHSVKVHLRGTKSNREGIGAFVTLVLPDGRRVMKAMDGKSGYLSQSDLPLYFGLGTADHATSLEVAWPSGRKQVVRGPLASGKVIEVVEP